MIMQTYLFLLHNDFQQLSHHSTSVNLLLISKYLQISPPHVRPSKMNLQPINANVMFSPRQQLSINYIKEREMFTWALHWYRLWRFKWKTASTCIETCKTNLWFSCFARSGVSYCLRSCNCQSFRDKNSKLKFSLETFNSYPWKKRLIASGQSSVFLKVVSLFKGYIFTLKFDKILDILLINAFY